MKNKKQIISRLLWIGNIFLLIFCLAGCGTSGTGTSESGTEQQESSSAAPNYYHKGKIFLPQADGKVTEEHEGVKLDPSLIYRIQIRDILWQRIRGVQTSC